MVKEVGDSPGGYCNKKPRKNFKNIVDSLGCYKMRTEKKSIELCNQEVTADLCQRSFNEVQTWTPGFSGSKSKLEINV